MDSIAHTAILRDNSTDSIYIHDSIYVGYKFGGIDTINKVRVDTMIMYRDKILYRKLFNDKIYLDTSYIYQTDTIYKVKTNTEYKTKNVARELTFFERTKLFLEDAVISSIILVVCYLLVKYKFNF